MCLTTEPITKDSILVAKDEKSPTNIYLTKNLKPVFQTKAYQSLSPDEQQAVKDDYERQEQGRSFPDVDISLIPHIDYNTRLFYLLVGKSGSGKSWFLSKLVDDYYKNNKNRPAYYITSKGQYDDPALKKFYGYTIEVMNDKGIIEQQPFLRYISPVVFLKQNVTLDSIADNVLWLIDDIIEMSSLSEQHTKELDEFTSKLSLKEKTKSFELMKSKLLGFVSDAAQLGRAKRLHMIVTLHQLRNSELKINNLLLKEALYVHTFLNDLSQVQTYVIDKLRYPKKVWRNLIKIIQNNGHQDYDYLIHMITPAFNLFLTKSTITNANKLFLF